MATMARSALLPQAAGCSLSVVLHHPYFSPELTRLIQNLDSIHCNCQLVASNLDTLPTWQTLATLASHELLEWMERLWLIVHKVCCQILPIETFTYVLGENADMGFSICRKVGTISARKVM
jgi:hypothetical protein